VGFVTVTDREVQFVRKDLKLERQVLTRYPIEEFIATLAEPVPDHYRQRDSLFRIAGPWFHGPDLCGVIRTDGTGEAPSSTTSSRSS
jgi:hypothetical protein